MSTGTVLSGSLKDFGLVEVLQVMELGEMTGAISLKQNTGRMGILYFNEGKMANCSEFDPGALTLGDVLQQLSMTTYQHIEEAFSQQLQDPFGMRIGERLVVRGVISEKQLKDALRTKALWTARELALWKEGTYEFIPSPSVYKLLPYKEHSLDIEVMRVTMEMIRYSDEWDGLIRSLPQGMRTALVMSPAIPYNMRFDMSTLELFTHVNLYHRVRRIASALRRPELEVARELEQLVQQKFLLVAPQQDAFMGSQYSSNAHKVHLPAHTEKTRLEDFELLNLISRMEQEWMKRRTPMQQLSALVEFVNWTMDALAESFRANGMELDPNTLKMLMINNNLSNMGTYEFKVEQNHIDAESFTALCYEVLSGDMKKAEDFYDEATMVLHRLLCSLFESINARVANPRERIENQEVWEAMFEQLAVKRTQIDRNNTITYTGAAIARVSLEDDGRALIGKTYSIQAGFAPSVPKNFKGDTFSLATVDVYNSIMLDISFHTSENIKIIGEWDKSLRYDLHAAWPQLTEFTFQITEDGNSALVIDFFYERRWLKTTRLEFDVAQHSQFTPMLFEE